MKPRTRNQIVFTINFIVALLVGYCLVKYTQTMRNDSTCRYVKEQQRQFLYLSGILILVDVILTIIIKLL